MKIFSYIYSALLTSFLISCGGEKNPHLSLPSEPIDAYLQAETVNERPHLKIKDDAFNKDFLFYGHFIPMLMSPTGYSLKGRIVRFQLFSDRVLMLESAKGHAIGDEEESLILLEEFPIIKTQSDGVVIDFAKGMNSAFTMRNIQSQATVLANPITAEQFKALFLSSSFVRFIKDEDDVLTISQVAQWRNAKSELISAEFRYFLSEYRPDPKFQKVIAGKNRHVQFFQTPPMVEAPSTESIAYLTKWDLSQPIIFYLSANTPKDYKDAIIEGLLFWNQILGQELIEVRDLAENLSAPHHKFNIAQWVPWDNEASAYADMVVDPLTGQTLNARIYIRSGWVMDTKKKLSTQLEEIMLKAASNDEPPSDPLSDLSENGPCQKAMSNFYELYDLASGLELTSLKPTVMLKLTNDILRAVVAHEMGHVLGLRHNLAASTKSDLSLKERDEALASYLASGELPASFTKQELTASIMDVFGAADDALIGAQIHELMREPGLLAAHYQYDRQALDFGYFKKPMKGDTPFCTDEDITTFIDCRRWDFGGEPAHFASYRLNSLLKSVVIALVDTLITHLDPLRDGGQLLITDIPLNDQVVLKLADVYGKELFSWFDEKTRSIQIESSQSAFGPQNKDAITKVRFSELRQEIESHGLNASYFALLPPFKAGIVDDKYLADIFSIQLKKRLNALAAERPDFVVSAETKEAAIALGKSYFQHLYGEMLKVILNVITNAHFDDPDLQLPIEEALGKIAKELILSTKQAQEGSLPLFRYELKTRYLALGLLNPTLGILPDWSFDNLNQVTNELKELMRRHGGYSENNKVDLSTLPRPTRQWLIEQYRLLTKLLQLKDLQRPIPSVIKGPEAVPPKKAESP